MADGQSRALVFLAADVAHIALIALLATARPVRYQRANEENRSVLILLEPEAIAAPAKIVPPQEFQIRRRAQRAPDRARELPVESRAISEPPAHGSAAPPGPSIDWTRESQLAAERQVDTLEAARRRARGFTPAQQEREPVAPSAPAPEFGWDTSRTQRIEPIPSGGTLIHLNDRCVLALAGFIMPMCKIGKIEARGDLFEHMNDTPPLGDPK